MNELRLQFVCTAMNEYWDLFYMENPLTVQGIKKMNMSELEKLLQRIWKSTDMPAPPGFIIPEKETRKFFQLCADEIGEVLRSKKTRFAPPDGAQRTVNTWQG